MSLSEKVLTRKRARTKTRLLSIVFLTCALFSLSNVAYLTWHEHKRNTPDWLHGASLDGDLHEHITFNQPSHEVPFRAVINGETWIFVQVDHFDDTTKEKAGDITGETDCKNQEITYIPSEDKSELRTNIMHEIFHAGACLHGGDKWWNSDHPTDDKHPGIYHLADFMHSFLHENPQFAVWLTEE